jgi:RNA-directed DNA polymerase
MVKTGKPASGVVKFQPMSFDERIKKLHEIQRGWLNAFKYANIKGKDGWLRNRLRYCI